MAVLVAALEARLGVVPLEVRQLPCVDRAATLPATAAAVHRHNLILFTALKSFSSLAFMDRPAPLFHAHVLFTYKLKAK